jgi:hypothetical protein
MIAWYNITPKSAKTSKTKTRRKTKMSKTNGKMLGPRKFRTPEFRVSFPHVFEAVGFEGEDPCYSVTCLFDGDKSMKVFEKAIEGVINEKLNGRRPGGLKVSGARDGDEIYTQDGKPRPECAGQTVIRLKSKHRKPQVFDASRNQIVDPEEIYGGCYAIAVVEAYYWSNSFGKGISYSLLGLQKTRDGDAFVGGVSSNDFEDHSDEEEVF